MKQSNQKRRHYLISHRFQLRFALQILLLLIFTSVVIGWTVYYSVWSATEVQLQRLLTSERIDQAEVTQFRQAIRAEAGGRVLFRLLLLVFMAFVFTVFATHRMAGPIRHIEKALLDHFRGDPFIPVKLRKTDEFQDLAGLINQLLASERRLPDSALSSQPDKT